MNYFIDNSNSYKIPCNADPFVISQNINENIQPNLASKPYIFLNKNPPSNHEFVGYAKHKSSQIEEQNPGSNLQPPKTPIGIKEVPQSAETKVRKTRLKKVGTYL